MSNDESKISDITGLIVHHYIEESDYIEDNSIRIIGTYILEKTYVRTGQIRTTRTIRTLHVRFSLL